MERPPKDIARILEPALNEDPERLAVTASSGSLSYAQLDERANRWARVLRDHGVERGDRVAASLPNDLEIIAAFHGVMRLGAIWVGVNEALAGPEKAYILGHSEAKVFLCGSEAAAQIEAHRDGVPAGLRVVVVTGEGSGELESMLAAAGTAPPGVDVDVHAPAAIAYTSGTTGRPKGVVHSQWNLLLPGAYINATRGYDSSLRKGDCFPLTILNLMVLTTLLTSQAKGLAVIMDRVSADAVAKWVSAERVTVWNGPPPLLYTLAHADEIPADSLRTLREVWSGGADCPESIRSAFEAKFGVEIRGTYGLTEAPTVVTIEVPGTPHVDGSSGTPLPHLEVTIRDESGAVLPAGETGEVCVGPRDPDAIGARLREDWGVEAGDGPLPEYRPMLGYWNQPEESEKALARGYLRTGDAGRLEDGQLTITDRISLMLNRGGANVYPAEIERVAMAVDGVDGCGVFGVPDERLGERVAILIQFEAGAEPDLGAVIERIAAELAPYKVPELAAAVDSLPRNAMNKIDRRELARIGTPLVERVRRPSNA